MGIINGDGGNNNLVGTSNNDSIYGYGGNDTLDGGSGTDSLFGGDGNDTIYYDGVDLVSGGNGTDWLMLKVPASVNLTSGTFGDFENVSGSANNDNITGNSLNNVLIGNAGDDVLIGGAGVDSLYGGDGNDIIYYDGVDYVSGGNGTDYLELMQASTLNLTSAAFGDFEYVVGSAGNDEVWGNSLNNVLIGNGGNDVLIGGAGVDSLYGGDGDDIIYYDGVDYVSGGNGTDYLELMQVTSLNLTSAAFGDFEYVVGSEGNDEVWGNSLNNVLIGNGGNDVLIGGAGVDSLYGGDGDDIIYYDGQDYVSGGNGTDYLELMQPTSVNLTSAAFGDFEYAVGSEGNDEVWGNNLNNVLIGNGGNDVLVGGAGVDSLYGGAGDDYIFYDGVDYVSGGTGNDWLMLSVPASVNLTSAAFGDFENVSGSDAADVITGNSGANQLVGNGGNDTLEGGGGNDDLNGGGGNDLYIFNSGFGSDTISGANAGDIVQFGSGFSTTNLSVAMSGSNLVISGAGNQLTILNWTPSSLNSFQFSNGTQATIQNGQWSTGGGSIVTDDYGNDIAHSSSLSLNQNITGAINYADDEDYFSFTAPTSGVYNFHTTGNSDTAGILYDSSGNVLTYGNDTSTTNLNFGFNWTMSQGQTCYIAVADYNIFGTGPYTLTVTNSQTGDDYGNRVGSATSVPLNQNVNGTINYANDWDYFSFTPTVTGAYTFHTTGNSDTYGALLDSNGNVLDASDDTSTTNYNFSFTDVLTAGHTYYAAVALYNPAATGTYTFSVVNGPTDDYGNNMETAANVALNQTLNGTINYASDSDYFSFIPTTTGTYTFSTTGSSDTIGALWDSNGNLLNSNDDGSIGDLNFSMTNVLVAGHTYYAGVALYNSTATGSYAFHVTGGTAVSDDYGNDTALASSLHLGQTINGNINYADDWDYFSFIPSSSGIYSFHTTGSTNTFGELFSSSDQLLTSGDDNGSGSNFDITYQLTQGQTYYLGVADYNPTLTGPYGLSVTNSVQPAGSDHALVVGVQQFNNSSLNLNFTDDDAMDMVDFLQTSPTWAGTQTDLLISQQASTGAIAQELTNIAGAVSPGDDVFLFFSTHGGAAASNNGLIATYDTAITSDEMHTAIQQIASHDSSGHILLVLDACESGSFVSALSDISNLTVMSACTWQESSVETPGQQNGAFTYFIDQALTNPGTIAIADTDHNHQLTTAEVFGYASSAATTYNPDQHAQMYDGSHGSWVLTTY